MPFLIPLISGVAAFFGGAYIGGVVNDATASPTVVIEEAEVTSSPKEQNFNSLFKYGLIGIGAYLLWKKLK